MYNSFYRQRLFERKGDHKKRSMGASEKNKKAK